MTAASDGKHTPTDAQSGSEVTLAFTDIESSTVRWERNRLAMQDAVRRHDAILEAAIAECGGHVFKTIGDAFCSVFGAPQDAVTAMLRAQLALFAEDFAAVDGLRVRAAIHTGSAELRGGDYFGPAANKVARLLAIGHGGQILLTAETAALVDSTLPDDVTLCELGAYHLKDFTEPQRLYQLLAPDLPAEFPPLRSLGTLPSDLSIIDAQEFHPVASFSGRDEELATLQAALKDDGAIAVVHGLGGMGKSSIAREYGWRNRERYSVVWWLNAQTEDAIIDGLLRVGAMFVKGLDQLTDRRVAAERVINSVLGGFDKPVLLVFDNLEDERLMRTWLPRTGARALATSRDAARGADITAIPLQPWSLETSVGYLLGASGRNDLDETGAHAIAQALGALPLALSHAAAALRSLRMVSPRRYLERINEHLHNAPRGAEYPRSVFATFSTAVAQAEQQAAGAAAVLCFATSFAPDAIPDELFRQPLETYAADLKPTLSETDALDLRSVLADDLRLDEALGALDRLSLLTFEESSRTYSMHRLVQLAGRDLEGDTAEAWREFAVEVVDAAFPEGEFATWPQCARMLPHVRAALESVASGTAFLPAGQLARRCGLYLAIRGEYSAAETLLARAVAIREKALGADHPSLAATLNNLGSVYKEQGRYEEAEPLHMRALAIREKSLGPDHPDVATSLNSLGNLCTDQGRYEEAEALYARALAIREKALGPDHPNVAWGLNNLANVYNEQGRYEEAEQLHRRALGIREKALGPDHPDVAFSLNNIGDVCYEQGRYEQGMAALTRALAIREKALGPDHPDVAFSLNNLASAYLDQQRFEEAEPLCLRALTIWEKALGPDHHFVAMALESISNMYYKQGRYEEAEPLCLRELTIREKALGPNHPYVAISLNNLANVYRDQRRYDEAEALYTRALAVRKEALGPDHPDVATSLSDWAKLYEAQGRHHDAEPLYVRGLAIREKALGSDHPQTKAVRERLEKLRSS